MTKVLRTLALALMPMLLLIVLGALVSIKPVTIKSDMLALISDQNGENHTRAQFYEAQQALLETQQAQMVLSFSGAHADDAYETLANKLSTLGVVVQKPLSETNQIIDFYAPYQGALMSHAYTKALGTPQSFTDYFSTQFSQTSSPWLSQSFKHDPSLATYSFVNQLNKQQPLSILNGKLQTLNESSEPVLILIANSTGNNNAVSTITARADEIIGAVNDVQAQFENTDIQYSGVIFHNAENAKQAQWEMNRFGAASLLLLCVFVVLFMRGLAPLWVSTVTVLSAILSGLLLLIVVREEVHVITLVFATTLIGVAIDYAFHALVDRTQKRGKYSNDLKRGLKLALVSTAIGYLCFFVAPLRLLQDVAIFVCGGLFGAYVFVRFMLPIAQVSVQFNDYAEVFADTMMKTQNRLRAYSIKIGMGIFVLCCAIVIVKPPTLNDSIASFNASSAKLINAQMLHQSYLSAERTTRLLVSGSSVQNLLEQEERVSDWIVSEKGQTLGLSTFLPSMARQNASLMLFQQAAQGNVFSIITQFTNQDVKVQNASLLNYETFNKGPLGNVVQHPVKLNNAVYSLMNVTGISAQNLAKQCALWQSCMVVDVPTQLSNLLAHFHSNVHVALALALCAIGIIFVGSFGLVRGLSMSAWLSLTVLLVVTVLSFSADISVFHTLGLILVLALAVDYFIFYNQGGYKVSTYVAISLSALSSLAVFAMLVFSKTPAISQFGAAVLVGLIVVYFMAPLSIENKNDKQ
ncbi:hypothetical protein AAEU32_13820 [Pseudoalteromonas sp. SSDWG2]|uniref:hypothetical protein n=1 Tax=Pseudoalteromonas sp. SSDWG2 TaxID=3139391 RepID=UPI003BAC8419